MTALLIVHITVRDPEQMQAYGAAASPIVTAHGGEFILRGTYAGSLLGNRSVNAVALIRFPNVDTAKHWFASPEYQALSEQRNAAADMEFTLYEAA